MIGRRAVAEDRIPGATRDAGRTILTLLPPQERDHAVSRDDWVQKSLFGHEPAALEAQKPAREQRASDESFSASPSS
ncbi:MAG: hypothetical protein P8R42_10195 [Candidatus Binatia bacterium]|nr:hypothetical protein [Candidatus Binatia bacterium]